MAGFTVTGAAALMIVVVLLDVFAALVLLAADSQTQRRGSRLDKVRNACAEAAVIRIV